MPTSCSTGQPASFSSRGRINGSDSGRRVCGRGRSSWRAPGPPRGGRNLRHLEAGEPHRADRPLGTALAPNARGRRGGGRRTPASRGRRNRGGLEHVAA
jgi:hypothetical protein